MADSSPAAMPSLSQRPRLGARLGMLFGGVVVSLWSLLILGGFVEVAVQASGLVKVAHGYLAEGSERRMSEYREGGVQVERPIKDPAAEAAFELLIQAITFLVVLVIDIFSLFVYYSCYIKPTFKNFIPKNAIIPEDLMGRFKYNIFDFGDCGWIHASLDKTQVNCDGWQWCAGVCAYVGVSSIAQGCLPCAFAALRNGLSFVDGGDGGLGDIIPLKKMFGIPTSTCSDFCCDVCRYCWCTPCVATQEYRQVMEVLKRGQPLVQAQAVTDVVVGNAVVVGAPVQQAQPKE